MQQGQGILEAWPSSKSKMSSHLCCCLYHSLHSNLNKNSFQLKAHIPLANTKLNTYNLTLECSWTLNDLDIIYNLYLIISINKYEKVKVMFRQWNNQFLVYDLNLDPMILILKHRCTVVPNWSELIQKFQTE